jgi:hypothetical protein
VNSVRTGALAVVLMLVAGCSGQGQTPAQKASGYISKHGAEALALQQDIAAVQAAMTRVIARPTTETVNALALVAQQAHDDISSGKDSFAQVGGGGDVGNAITSVYSAVNDLKNAMGGIVAFTGNPNPATQAKMTLQYQTAVQEWNDAVTTIWSTAGQDQPPTV